MKKKNKLEELADRSDNLPGEDVQSFREMYEQRFSRWLESDVELIQVTRNFRLASIHEAAQLAVDYFTRKAEMSQPQTISGLAGALKLGSTAALDLYKTYHEDYASFIDEAKMVCEEYAEDALFSKNSSGARFVLMNRNRWSNIEKSEVTTHNIDVKI